MENTAADSTSLIGCSSIGWEVGRYAEGLAVPGVASAHDSTRAASHEGAPG